MFEQSPGCGRSRLPRPRGSPRRSGSFWPRSRSTRCCSYGSPAPPATARSTRCTARGSAGGRRSRGSSSSGTREARLWWIGMYISARDRRGGIWSGRQGSRPRPPGLGVLDRDDAISPPGCYARKDAVDGRLEDDGFAPEPERSSWENVPSGPRVMTVISSPCTLSKRR